MEPDASAFVYNQLSAKPKTLEKLNKLVVPRYLSADVVNLLTNNQTDRLPTALVRNESEDYDLDSNLRDLILRKQSESEQGRAHLEQIHQQLLDYFNDKDRESPEVVYHMLGAHSGRETSVVYLENTVREHLRDNRVSLASDAIQAAKDWARIAPANTEEQLAQRIRLLEPIVAMHTRWSRERAATTFYQHRKFEDKLWESITNTNSAHWVVQLYGPGGHGKTMLLSNLLSRRCPNNEIPCAKIDFDFVANLVATSNQPWRILLVIARQLAYQFPDEPFTAFLNKWSKFEVRYTPYRPTKPAQEFRSDSEESVAKTEIPQTFTRILKEVSNNKTVVIVLDTLENLLFTDGGTIRAILDELSAVHREVPRLRLILAGRFDLGGTLRVQTTDKERVPGFQEKYGPDSQNWEIQPFTEQEAYHYLTGLRTLAADRDTLNTIVSKAQGNPLKLAMLADIAQDSKNIQQDLSTLKSVELHYLVIRIIDRISDPTVRWLVRWGVIPKILSEQFAREALWPLLVEQLQANKLDDPSKTPDKDIGIGPSRYQVNTQEISFQTTWNALMAYAAKSSWVDVPAELPGCLRFHSEVQDPVRNMLRESELPIFKEVSQRAFEYWFTTAQNTKGSERAVALRSVVFHMFDLPDTDCDHQAVWQDILSQVEQDRALGGEIAKELFELWSRSTRYAHESLTQEMVKEAHSMAARSMVMSLSTSGDLELLRYHLAESNLSDIDRLVLEARASVTANTNVEQQLERVYHAVASLNETDRIWVTSTLAVRRNDVTLARNLLASIHRETPEWYSVAKLLANLLYRNEQYTDAAELFHVTSETVSEIHCYLKLGEYNKASRLMRSPQENPTYSEVWCELRLAEFNPIPIIELQRKGQLSSLEHESLLAKANAMLSDEQSSKEHLETFLITTEYLGASDAIATARIYLDRGVPQTARRILTALSPGEDPRLATKRALLMLEADAALGIDVSEAQQWQTIRPDVPRLKLDAALTEAQIFGLQKTILQTIIDIVKSLPTPQARLVALFGLRRVGDYHGSPDDCRSLLELTALDPSETMPSLVLSRAEVLRICSEKDVAFALLSRLGESQQPVVVRYAFRGVDRLGEAWLKQTTHWMNTHLDVPGLGSDSRQRSTGNLPGNRTLGPLRERANKTARPQATLESLGGAYEDARLRLYQDDIPMPWRSMVSHNNSTELQARLRESAAVAHEFSTSLGRVFERLRGGKPRDVLINTTDMETWWVPWQSGMIDGVSVLEHYHIRAIIKTSTHRPLIPQETPMKSEAKTVTIVIGRDFQRAEYAYKSWANAGFSVSMQGTEPTQFASSTIVHFIADFVDRRGLVAMQVGPQEYSSSALARPLTESPYRPLYILDTLWTRSDGSPIATAILREQFASELFTAAPNVHILCPNIRDFSPSTYDQLARRLNEESLVFVTSRLQHENFPEHPGYTTASLYSNDYEVRITL